MPWTQQEFFKYFRRIKLAGKNARIPKIADKIGISHQRVMQIINASGQSSYYKRRRQSAFNEVAR